MSSSLSSSSSPSSSSSSSSSPIVPVQISRGDTVGKLPRPSPLVRGKAMTPVDALLAATMAANLASEAAVEAANNAQETAQAAAQAAAEAVRAAQAAQATASSSTRNYAVVPEIPVRLLRSRRGFLRIPKFRMSGKPRKQLKASRTKKRKPSFQTVAVEILSRSPSPEVTHSSRRQRISNALPEVVPMDTTGGGGSRLTDRKKTKKQKKYRCK